MVSRFRLAWELWRKRAAQIAAGLAVFGAGYVSLGTSCASEEIVVTAEREVVFLEGDPEHFVRVRLTPSGWSSLTLSSDAPLRLVAGDTGPDGGMKVQGSGDGSSQLSLTCSEWEGCSTDLTVAVERAGQPGPFTSVVHANFAARSACSGAPPPVVEVRLDVEG
jgi:hypothetical protein